MAKEEKESEERKQLTAQLNQLAGRINGQYGKVDWMREAKELFRSS